MRGTGGSRPISPGVRWPRRLAALLVAVVLSAVGVAISAPSAGASTGTVCWDGTIAIGTPCPGPPTVGSAASATFTEGVPGSFEAWGGSGSAVYSGTYQPMNLLGTLPAGLSWSTPSPSPACTQFILDNGGCWSGRLSGTPAKGTAGTYTLQIQPILNREQTFTLTVLPNPVTVSGFTAPQQLRGDPFTATFSAPVKGVDSTSFTVVRVGFSSGLAGTVSCRDALDAAVSCATGPVTKAQFTPTAALVAGEYYFVNVNPTTSGIVSYASSTPLAADQGYVRAQTQFTAFDYPVGYTWPKVTNAAALGGSYVQNIDAGQTVTFSAKGPAVGIITWNAPDGGQATVTVTTPNQAPVVRSIDTYGASPGDVTTTITGLSTGTHTVTVSVDGAHAPASTGNWVRVDGTVVAGKTKATPVLAASVWPNFPGDYAFTGLKNATATLTFRGTGVDWTALVGPNNGRAKVAIDGVVVNSKLDLWAPGYAYQTFAFNGLVDTVHTVVITCLGTKQAASSGTIVTLKALTVE